MSSELVRRRLETWAWRDNFTRETLEILAQHAVQSRMTRVDTALARSASTTFEIIFFKALRSYCELLRRKDLKRTFPEPSLNLP